MKKVAIVKSGPALPTSATALPANTVLEGKKFGHVYQVRGGQVVNVATGKVSRDTAMGNYNIVPKGSKVTFEVPV